MKLRCSDKIIISRALLSVHVGLVFCKIGDVVLPTTNSLIWHCKYFAADYSTMCQLQTALSADGNAGMSRASLKSENHCTY